MVFFSPIQWSRFQIQFMEYYLQSPPKTKSFTSSKSSLKCWRKSPWNTFYLFNIPLVSENSLHYKCWGGGHQLPLQTSFLPVWPFALKLPQFHHTGPLCPPPCPASTSPSPVPTPDNPTNLSGIALVPWGCSIRVHTTRLHLLVVQLKFYSP